MKSYIEYRLGKVNFFESIDKTYKSRKNNLDIRVVDDGVNKGKIYINDNLICNYSFDNTGISVVDIENAEIFVMTFLELLNDVISNISGEEEVEAGLGEDESEFGNKGFGLEEKEEEEGEGEGEEEKEGKEGEEGGELEVSKEEVKKSEEKFKEMLKG